MDLGPEYLGEKRKLQEVNFLKKYRKQGKGTKRGKKENIDELLRGARCLGFS